MTPKASVTKEKLDKWDFTIIRNLCASKDIIKKVKKTEENGRKFLQIMYVSGKGLVFRI